MPDTHNTHIKAPHRARDGGGWYVAAPHTRPFPCQASHAAFPRAPE